MKIIDVTVPLDAHLPSYPGNTPFTLEATQRIAQGGHSNVSALHMSAHAGTHVDAPRHFFDSGAGAEALPLELMFGRVRVVEIASRRGIDAEELSAVNLVEEIRVLFKTPNSKLWGDPEFHKDYVGVTES